MAYRRRTTLVIAQVCSYLAWFVFYLSRYRSRSTYIYIYIYIYGRVLNVCVCAQAFYFMLYVDMYLSILCCFMFNVDIITSIITHLHIKCVFVFVHLSISLRSNREKGPVDGSYNPAPDLSFRATSQYLQHEACTTDDVSDDDLPCSDRLALLV